MIQDFTRLQRTFGDPALEWLLHRIRRRLENGRGLQDTMTLRDPTKPQREAVARLFGRSIWQTGAISVRLSDLESLVRHAELCDSVTEAVEALTGPIINRRTLEAKVAVEWEDVFNDMETRLGERPFAREWLAELKQTGLVRRLSRDDTNRGSILGAQAVNVVERLPAAGAPLSKIAAMATGDGHALDAGRPLSAILLRMIVRISGIDEWTSPDGRRSAWASVGIIVDELSAPVLVLNLRSRGHSKLDRALDLHADIGEPYRLSTRQLLRSGIEFTPSSVGPRIYVCENPTVVAAAANEIGPKSAPLLCVEGQPKTPAHILLQKLRAAGVNIAYHGDFDWPGIHIANLMVRRYGVAPWRFGVTDYCQSPKGKTLTGKPVVACWDSNLTDSMLKEQRSVHEEAVLQQLLADLD